MLRCATRGFYNILKLENHKERVVLNDQASLWIDANDGVPQGSILGPLFF